MHIQERSNTILTTCSKMTEEVDRRHGINGNSSTGVTEDINLQNTTSNPSTGGRLKFFKDGKFILELARAKDGERVGWVSVPRKTFWPPAQAAAAPAAPLQAQRHERATSLSVSDDNSSIQSSPWQRDHCWKQSTPRKNICKELAHFYCRPASLRTSIIQPGTKRKRRRPYDTTQIDSLASCLKNPLSNGLGLSIKKNSIRPPAVAKSCEDVDNDKQSNNASENSKTIDSECWGEVYHHKHKKAYQYHNKLKIYQKEKKGRKQKNLSKVIEVLKEKISSLPLPVNAKLSSLCSRSDHMMVSPRKRILRELERVTLEDQSTKRRAKTVPSLSTASYPASPGPSHMSPKATEAPTSKAYNGVGHTSSRRESPVSKNVSSYSIHSLLSMPDDNCSRRSPEVQTKKSPQVYTPASVMVGSPSNVRSPDLSPSPENYRHKYTVPPHRSSPVHHYTSSSPHTLPPGLRDSPTPPPDHLSRFRPAYLSSHSAPPTSSSAPPFSALPNSYSRHSPISGVSNSQHKSPQYYPTLLPSPSQISSPHYRSSPTPKRSPGPDACTGTSRGLPSPLPARPSSTDRSAPRASPNGVERPHTRYSEHRVRYSEPQDVWRAERDGSSFGLSPSERGGAPLAYLYPGSYVTPPYVSGLPYRAGAAPLWMHYAVAPGIPPGPWAPMPHPLLTDHIPKEDPGSDLPLNLSKH